MTIFIVFVLSQRRQDCSLLRCYIYYSVLLLLSRSSRVQLWDPTDSSPPGSPVPGILQARTLEWVAISFSSAWKWKVKVKSLSRVRLFVTPWDCSLPGSSVQEYWSGLPLPSPSYTLPWFISATWQTSIQQKGFTKGNTWKLTAILIP